MPVIGAAGAVTLISVVEAAVIYGLPLWALVSVIRNLRGGLRIFWVALIIASWLFITLIGLVLSVMYLVFQRRFVAVQRTSTRRPKRPRPGA